MKHAGPLNPTTPAYILDSPEEKLVVNVARSSVFIGVVGLVVIGLSFWHNWHIKLVVSILAGLCATLPPLWFSYEHFFLYRRKGVPGSFELFKQGQQVAFTVWAGFTTALVALAASDFVSNQNDEYKCEVVLPGAPASLSAPLQLVCRPK